MAAQMFIGRAAARLNGFLWRKRDQRQQMSYPAAASEIVIISAQIQPSAAGTS
jgi:hypothetical protein